MSSTNTTVRKRFAAWRRERPFWGGLILLLAGLVIAYIPLNLAMSIPLIPNHFAYIGLVFAAFVILCGIFTIVQPELATFFAAAGILLSIASIFGALGGFGVGTFLGIVGGSLVIAWEHPDERSDDDGSDRERSSILSRLAPPRFARRSE